MRTREVNKLKHGLYKIYWCSGGFSICAMGGDRNGDRWIASTNWTSGSIPFDKIKRDILKMELLISREYDSAGHYIKQYSK